jgi:hypothetical protein
LDEKKEKKNRAQHDAVPAEDNEGVCLDVAQPPQTTPIAKGRRKD